MGADYGGKAEVKPHRGSWRGAWHDLQELGAPCHAHPQQISGLVFTIQCLLPRLDAAKVPACVRTCARSLGTPGQQNPQPPRPFLAESPVLTRPELLMPLSSIQWHKLLAVCVRVQTFHSPDCFLHLSY